MAVGVAIVLGVTCVFWYRENSTDTELRSGDLTDTELRSGDLPIADDQGIPPNTEDGPGEEQAGSGSHTRDGSSHSHQSSEDLVPNDQISGPHGHTRNGLDSEEGTRGTSPSLNTRTNSTQGYLGMEWGWVLLEWNGNGCYWNGMGMDIIGMEMME